MRSIKALFMFAIGMMAFTATATTHVPEQKQKPELVKEFTFQTSTVSVEINQEAFVLTDVEKAELSNINVVQLKNATELYNHLAIVADVGWRSSKQRFSNIQNKEKVLQNYKNYLKLIKITKENRIRENPFEVMQTFKITRYC